VTFEDGVAGASSFEDDSLKPDNAFMKEEGKRWASGKGEASPHIIFYRFANALKVTKVAFEAHKPNMAPTDYEIVASNDENCDADSGWETLKQHQDITWSEGEVKTEIIPESQMYRCYGIRSNKFKSTWYQSTYNYFVSTSGLSLKKIRMWV
jgi:hypothetical protein